VTALLTEATLTEVPEKEAPERTPALDEALRDPVISREK
jgi:hypothetical protein